LKYFTEHLPATPIYAGIDVERCGVFTGTHGRQLASRCGLICTGAFPYRDEWAQLIAALEATLRSRHHQPGSLPAPDRLPPPPALDRPLRPQPRRAARRQPLPEILGAQRRHCHLAQVHHPWRLADAVRDATQAI
jgi:hypothetical protein